jgi:hypothetical protein
VRAELCEKLAASGVPRVEAASFVNPKRVPQMAGGEEVMGAIERRPGTVYAGLVLNEKGYERAITAGVGRGSLRVPCDRDVRGGTTRTRPSRGPPGLQGGSWSGRGSTG